MTRTAEEIRKGRACDVLLCIHYYSPGCCSYEGTVPSNCPRAIRAERDQLAADLATNAKLLARQTDLAREAETRLERAELLGDALVPYVCSYLNKLEENGVSPIYEGLVTEANAALTAWRGRAK